MSPIPGCARAAGDRKFKASGPGRVPPFKPRCRLVLAVLGFSWRECFSTEKWLEIWRHRLGQASKGSQKPKTDEVQLRAESAPFVVPWHVRPPWFRPFRPSQLGIEVASCTCWPQIHLRTKMYNVWCYDMLWWYIYIYSIYTHSVLGLWPWHTYISWSHILHILSLHFHPLQSSCNPARRRAAAFLAENNWDTWRTLQIV